MDADADGGFIEEAVDDVDLVLDGFERFEALAEFQFSARAFGPPVIPVDAVAHEHHGGNTSDR